MTPSRRKMKKLGIALIVVLAVAVAAFFFVIPQVVERIRNGVYPGTAPAVPQAVADLHARLLIADMHADSLLWGRDLLQRSSVGHVDIPRLIAGNVALIGFSVVTKTPRGLNIDRNAADSDNITLLAIAQRWPPATWFSLKERALYQARRMHEFARRSGGKLTLIENRDDLARYLAERRSDPERTAGWLALEGAHALEGDPSNLDALFDAGYRVIAPTHLFDSEFAGSASGVGKGGLTASGREWLRRMEAKHMIVDLAHASSQTIDDVLALAQRPVVVSHTGVKGTCDNNRNLSDNQVRAVARKGGLIGIGLWEAATCGRDVASSVRAIRYTANLVGFDHVALGSDWDGSVAAPIDAGQTVQLTQALLESGLTPDQVAMVMGGNVVRLLSQLLP
ncbi:MAG TPA: membrane dipeptidase [Burkholderiales bacterium]|nr:membrane dipeptidase [Burkholderiales bacterium]